MYFRMVRFLRCMALELSKNYDTSESPFESCRLSFNLRRITSLPQGHDLNRPEGHGPQSPLWHLTLHRCRPHSYDLLHVFSHDHTMLLQSRSCVLLPHRHCCWLFFVHGGHSAWHGSLHVCIPQASNFEH